MIGFVFRQIKVMSKQGLNGGKGKVKKWGKKSQEVKDYVRNKEVMNWGNESRDR